MSAWPVRLAPDVSDNGSRQLVDSQTRHQLSQQGVLGTPREDKPRGDSRGNPDNHSGWTPDRSPVRHHAPPSPFEQPPPKKEPTFTAVTDTPIPSRQPRGFGDRPSTASNLPSEPILRNATPTQVQLQVQALHLEKRRLNEEQRLLREDLQAARTDLQTVTSEIDAKTKIRDDERLRAYSEQLMHKREHYEQLRQYTEIEDEAKRRLAQLRSERENLQALTVFQKQYPLQDFRMPPRPSTSSYLDGPPAHANARVQVVRIQRPALQTYPYSATEIFPVPPKRIQSLPLSESDPPIFGASNSPVPRHSSNADSAFFQPIRTQPELQRVHSSIHAGSASHQPQALPPVSDYLATSSSLETRVPALCDTIVRLSGCLECVVTKVAEGAISSKSSSSRHHVVQKTEESTCHPQCALRTVPLYSSSVFSASVPAAVVSHADPPPPPQRVGPR